MCTTHPTPWHPYVGTEPYARCLAHGRASLMIGASGYMNATVVCVWKCPRQEGGWDQEAWRVEEADGGPRIVHVLTPRAYQMDFIWEKGLCKCS